MRTARVRRDDGISITMVGAIRKSGADLHRARSIGGEDYSITVSARARRKDGMVSPIALAVLRLMISS